MALLSYGVWPSVVPSLCGKVPKVSGAPSNQQELPCAQSVVGTVREGWAGGSCQVWGRKMLVSLGREGWAGGWSRAAGSLSGSVRQRCPQRDKAPAIRTSTGRLSRELGIWGGQGSWEFPHNLGHRSPYGSGLLTSVGFLLCPLG